MRIQRGVPYGLTLIALLALVFTGWTHSTPASAQDDKAAPQPPPGRFPRGGGMASVAASGDFVYVVRGNTIFQLKSADLSVVTQKDLPAPAGEPAAPGAAENK